MKQLILSLAALRAPSGTESDVQQELLNHVRDVSDEAFIDSLGNGIARRHGTGPHIVLAAHVDEVGLMVIHAEDDGFLRVIPVGDLKAYTLIGKHIHFTNGQHGIIGASGSTKVQDLTFDHLYVDIGAETGEEALDSVPIGSSGVIGESVMEVGQHRLGGRALDNRVGCAIAIEAFRAAASAGRKVSVTFTAQQTVGARGAKTAAFRLQPDLAIIIDAAPAGDAPDADRMSLRLGEGPAVKILDGTAVIPISIKDAFLKSAERAKLHVQHEVWPRGLSDAGAFHMAVDGIPVGGVSYPARYQGGPSVLVDLRDVEQAVRWIDQIIEDWSEDRTSN